LEELRNLEKTIGEVGDLAGLKPVFYRLEEIAEQYLNDAEVQDRISTVRQKLIARGTELRQGSAAQKSAPLSPPTRPIPRPATPPSGSSALDETQAVPGPPGTPRDPFSATPPPMPAHRRFRSTSEQAARTQPSAGPTPPGSTRNPTTTSSFPGGRTGTGAATPPPMPAAPTGPPPHETRGPVPPVSGPPRPPAAAWKQAVLTGAVLGVVLFAGLVAVVRQVHRKTDAPSGPAAAVPVQIQTTPSGAAIRINGEVRCTSDCTLELAPGTYRVEARMEGYNPAVTTITATPGEPLNLQLQIELQAQTVRLFTDLEAGQVSVDDQAAIPLQDGQMVLDGVAEGPHNIRVSGNMGSASFAFDVKSGATPVVRGPITAKNLVALLVASRGNEATVYSSQPGLKLAVGGAPAGEVRPEGTPLEVPAAGDYELTLGEGKDQKKMLVTFSPAPVLTAFIKADLNAGTLIVVAGEDDATVFLNGTPVRRKTSRGQLRIPNLNVRQYAVRVEKEGYIAAPAELHADIKKGEETRLQFKMQLAPKFAILQVRGAGAGTQVLLDGTAIGTTATDGSFAYGDIAPGDHTVELRRQGFQPKRLLRNFRAGEAVELEASDVVLQAVEPPKPVEVKKPEAPKLPPQRPVVRAGIQDFEGSWTKQDTWFMRRGGNQVLMKVTPVNGTLNFTITMLKETRLFGGRPLQWILNRIDARNYALFELDKRYFTRKDVVNGNDRRLARVPHNLSQDQKAYTLQIEATPESITHRIRRGGSWVVLDTWRDPSRDFSAGRFGFLIQGNDEVGVSDFSFEGK
jgi:hypothetical protein